MLPYWEIGAALETAPQEAAVFECKLWVATEWLTQCGRLLYKAMGSTEVLGEREQASINPGPQCEGVLPRSLERWEFWRSRLAELLSAKPEGEGGAEQPVLISGTSMSRIAQAVAVMDAASSTALEQGTEEPKDAAEKGKSGGGQGRRR